MHPNFGKVTHLTSDVTFRLNEISSREVSLRELIARELSAPVLIPEVGSKHDSFFLRNHPSFFLVERMNPRADTDIFRT